MPCMRNFTTLRTTGTFITTQCNECGTKFVVDRRYKDDIPCEKTAKPKKMDLERGNFFIEAEDRGKRNCHIHSAEYGMYILEIDDEKIAYC